tara:strand:+ start:198 stop:497 length:300 start_codon:yes stop_codon:yes gene_type:complete
MKHEQETIGNHIQYQNLASFYNLYFNHRHEMYLSEDLTIYEQQVMIDGLMECFLGETSFYGLINDADVKQLECIIERIGRKTKRELLKYEKLTIKQLKK